MITAAMVKELRDATGAGMMDCKNALVEAKGDKEKALTLLREKGLAKAAKKSGRAASTGIVNSYIHMGGKVGVLVEVNCETDFVAKTPDFQELVKDICLHITATNPSYLQRDDVPRDIIENEKDILKKQALREGKPEKVVEKIVEGRIEKFYKENCLLEQPFVKDEDKSIAELLNDNISKLGENIVIRRFTRYQLGEGLEDTQSCS